MEKISLAILAVVALVAIVGIIMQVHGTATGEVPYQTYQSTAQKCISACDARYGAGSEAYSLCVQEDCLPQRY